eukprot:m.113446 g.113446  ORF g.113446 m.113446 type:complete len:211 (+) comp37458_c1_seq35:47-679(+)
MQSPLVETNSLSPDEIPEEDTENEDEGVFTSNEARDMMAILDRVEASVGALRTHLVEQDSLPASKRKRIPKWITKNLLLLTLVWQVACVVALTVVELVDHVPDKKLVKDKTYIVGVVVLAIFQGLNLLLVVFTSVKLAKQIIHHTASSLFLMQSYVSTLLLFAGFYTLIFRLDVSVVRIYVEVLTLHVFRKSLSLESRKQVVQTMKKSPC